MLTRSKKEEIVSGLKSDIEKAQAIFVTDLIGMPSNDSAAIRKGVREAGGKITIARNTLFARAAKGTEMEKLLTDLKGSHAVAFAFEDAPPVAKCLKDAQEDFEFVAFKGGLLRGEEITAAQIKELADLPSRSEMLGTLLATFMAPASTFARLLNAIKDECEKQGVKSPAELKNE